MGASCPHCPRDGVFDMFMKGSNTSARRVVGCWYVGGTTLVRTRALATQCLAVPAHCTVCAGAHDECSGARQLGTVRSAICLGGVDGRLLEELFGANVSTARWLDGRATDCIFGYRGKIMNEHWTAHVLTEANDSPTNASKTTNTSPPHDEQGASAPPATVISVVGVGRRHTCNSAQGPS